MNAKVKLYSFQGESVIWTGKGIYSLTTIDVGTMYVRLFTVKEIEDEMEKGKAVHLSYADLVVEEV